MKRLFGSLALLSLVSLSPALAEGPATMTGSKPVLSYEDARQVAPALEAYTAARLSSRRLNRVIFAAASST